MSRIRVRPFWRAAIDKPFATPTADLTRADDTQMPLLTSVHILNLRLPVEVVATQLGVARAEFSRMTLRSRSLSISRNASLLMRPSLRS